jgi:hypothetical protein
MRKRVSTQQYISSNVQYTVNRGEDFAYNCIARVDDVCIYIYSTVPPRRLVLTTQRVGVCPPYSHSLEINHHCHSAAPIAASLDRSSIQGNIHGRCTLSSLLAQDLPGCYLSLVKVYSRCGVRCYTVSAHGGTQTIIVDAHVHLTRWSTHTSAWQLTTLDVHCNHDASDAINTTARFFLLGCVDAD